MSRSARIAAVTLTTALLAAACSSEPAAGPSTTEREPVPGSIDRPTPTTLPTAGSTPDTTAPRPTQGGFGQAPLTFFGDCPALLGHLRAEAGARVTPWGLDTGGWFGFPGGRVFATDDAAAENAGGADGDTFAAPAATTAPDFSTTNTQEVGVDEGDVVETDGIHVFTAVGNALRVVNAANATVVAQPELPQGDHQLLLDGDRLLVTTQNWATGEDTVVSVFDVADAAAPQLLIRSHLEGRLVASRSVDGVVRLVLSASLGARLPFVSPDRFGLDEDAALERNREIIDSSAIEDWLPRRFDEAGDGSFGPMSTALDCTTVAAPREYSGLGISWIASVDLRGTATATGSAGIVSTGETVYASPTSLYVATVPWDWFRALEDDGAADRVVQPDQAPPTLIHAFSLDAGTGATYLASGEVPGRLLNQFAMSEHEGVLRVATTTDDWSFGGVGSESAVYVLRRNGDTLEQISSVGGLGRGERIFAVRFLGPTGYVVTFRQVDPLYVLDLSDPANPTLQGELKIPGYSAYLHPVGDGLLLGVGQDATEDGRTLGTQLSLFDVSVPTDPQRIATLPIGGFSDVEWDHRAFLYWPADGTIVLPVSPGWESCGPAIDCLADGLTASGSGGVVVARLVDRTLIGVGTISHESTDRWGCWNPLRRSLVIGDELVTLSYDRVSFSDRGTLARRADAVWSSDGACNW